MKHVLLPILTQAINRYLHLDNESAKRLSKLQGKRITVELLPFHWIFHCAFDDKGVAIEENGPTTYDTYLRGTPLQMMGVMLAKENRQHFFADDVTIEGDAEVGQQVIALFDELQIDWEYYLSRVVGDVPAYHARRLVESMNDWLKNTDNTFSQNVSEFIHEEARWLPAREALQDFFQDIDTLRMDVDRIEAKIRHLRDNLTNNEE